MTKRSIVDSKDYMAEALLFLMKRKPAAKITVSEITERAGVSRATWFRHFTDKREAVVYGLARLWEKWAESHGLTDSHRPSVENVESFVDYIYDIRSIRAAITMIGSDRLLYGSDFPLLLYPSKCREADFTMFIEDIRQNAGLSQEEWQQVMGGNFCAFLGDGSQ